MPSSELSNALNPYIAQSRSRASPSNYAPSYSPVAPLSQPYVPHRSELELAISEPPPPPPLTATQNLVPTRQPNPATLQALQELLRTVASTREAQETERKRHMAWEQQQEAKSAQKQAEMERALLELRQELNTLRSTVNENTRPPPVSGLLTPQYNVSPPLVLQTPQQPASPVSPVSQPSSYTYPTFVQGSSCEPPSIQQPYHNHFHMVPYSEPVGVGTPAPSMTPSPSPQLVAVLPSRSHRNISIAPVNGKKRHKSELSSDEESSSSDSSRSYSGRRSKRTNHHDRRLLTINHAMREHMLRVMLLEKGKDLPDSHTEGVELGNNDPVRFVWDKTTKQSVHNNKMKTRVIAHIKENRRLYKHVPDKEFSKKGIETAFEAAFVTFRTKFRAQRDQAIALHHKKREDAKARRSRHSSRRRTKLSNRAEARMKVEALQHVTFDGAFQLDCMSSEDSDDDGNGGQVLRTRGYAWRSARLNRFYSILDDEERLDKFSMPKRGVGRKERCAGPPKEGFPMPPPRVASWMISRRWIKASQVQRSDLTSVLKGLIEDPPGFDWDHFDVLGEESELSGDETQTFDAQNPYVARHHGQSMSSLTYALT